MADYLIFKEWFAIGFNWRILRERNKMWYYLERDGKIIAEGMDTVELLEIGWYK